MIGRPPETQHGAARRGRRRPARVLTALAAGLTALGVLTSCSAAGTGSGAPATGPGVAAVVGDQVVPTDLLTARVRTAAPALAQALAQQGGTSERSPSTPAAWTRRRWRPRAGSCWAPPCCTR